VKAFHQMIVIEDKDKIEVDLEQRCSDETVALRIGEFGCDIWIWITKAKLKDLATIIDLALQADDDQQREARGRLRDGDKDAKLGAEDEMPF
jgi:hypothetical protein